MNITSSILRPLFLDNPVLDYFNRSARRRFRRWGWTLGFLPLVLIGWFAFFEALFLSESDPDPGTGPATWAALAGGLTVMIFAGAVCVFSMNGVARLLHPDRVEPLLLTQLAPQQIWAAALVNMNRNLAVVGSLTVPVVFCFAALARLPLGILVRDTAWLWVFANLWTLAFAAFALQRGFRFSAFFNTVVLAAYLFFSLLALPGSSLGVPLALGLHPFPVVIRDFIPLFVYSHSGIEPGFPTGWRPLPLSLSILGWSAPFQLSLAFVLLFLGSSLIGLLLTGPMRPPRFDVDETPPPRPGEKRGPSRRLRAGLWRWAARPFPSLLPEARYPWRQIADRLYENPPRVLRRRAYLAKNVVGGALWLLLVMTAADLTMLRAGLFGRIGNSFTLRWGLFAALGGLAALHFAYDGAPGILRPPSPSLCSRSMAYAFKIATLLGAVCLAALFDPAPPSDWWAASGFAKGFLFAALVVASQTAFQLWVSSKVHQAALAVVLGLIHFLAVWLGPFLFLLFSWSGPRWILRLVSISPPWALASLGGRGVWSIYPFPAAIVLDWRWSAAFLAAELLLFAGLLARRPVKRAMRTTLFLAVIAGAMALAAPGRAADGQPEPSRVRLRQDLLDPERALITLCNDSPATQTGVLYCRQFGPSPQPELKRSLGPPLSFRPQQSRSLVLPVLPLLSQTQAPFSSMRAYLGLDLSGGQPMGQQRQSPASVFGFAPVSFPALRPFGGNYRGYSQLAATFYSPFVDRSFLVHLQWDTDVRGSWNPYSAAGTHGDTSVTSGDGSAFPNDPAQLVWFTAIFLDGPAARSWSQSQRQALEIWVARGGVLFLDPQALNSLHGSPLVTGARADLGAKRRIDLTVLKPPAPTPAPAPSLGSPTPPGNPNERRQGRQAANPSSRPVQEKKAQPAKPVWVPAFKLVVDGLGPDARPLSGAPPRLCAIGEGPDLVSWRFGAGAVAAQSFEGVGDEACLERWLRFQMDRRPHDRTAFGHVLAPFLDASLAISPAGSGSSVGFSDLARLPRLFPDLKPVYAGLGALLCAGFILFLFVRRGSWRRVLAVYWAVAGLISLGIVALRGGPAQTAATVFDAVIALPGTPWRERQVSLMLRAGKGGKANVELARDFPFQVTRSSAEDLSSGAMQPLQPLPLFSPGRSLSKRFQNGTPPIACGATRAMYFNLVERAETPGLVAELQIEPAGLRGTIRNESGFTLLDGVLRAGGEGQEYAARLQSPFRPGETTQIQPLAQAAPVSPTANLRVRALLPQVLRPGGSLAFQPGQISTIIISRGPRQQPIGDMYTLLDDPGSRFPADAGLVLARIEESPDPSAILRISPPPLAVHQESAYLQLVYLH